LLAQPHSVQPNSLCFLPSPTSPAASHANRYEFRCSAGHKLFYHRECWLKATVRWVDLKGQEHEKEGRDFKFNSYKKEHRRSCILPGCGGIVTFIEGPNKYGILNVSGCCLLLAASLPC
jgi:hypothetical protein